MLRGRSTIRTWPILHNARHITEMPHSSPPAPPPTGPVVQQHRALQLRRFRHARHAPCPERHTRSPDTCFTLDKGACGGATAHRPPSGFVIVGLRFGGAGSCGGLVETKWQAVHAG